jgi:hypothetical protein
MVAAVCVLSKLSAEVKTVRGQTRSIRYFLNVHESPCEWIKIGPKKYTGLRSCNVTQGEDSFVRAIPESHRILFITDGDEGEGGYGKIHVVSLEDGSEIVISDKGTDFSAIISSPHVLCGWNPTSQAVSVELRLNDRSFRFILDLQKRSVTEVRQIRDQVDKFTSTQ